MLKIEFATLNSAYHLEGDSDGVNGDAVADTLRGVARQIADGHAMGRILDPNGSRVGDWTLDPYA